MLVAQALGEYSIAASLATAIASVSSLLNNTFGDHRDMVLTCTGVLALLWLFFLRR